MSDKTKPLALVVDDEEMLREVMVMILEEAGYQVVAASDGPQAVQAASNLGRAITVAIIDFSMPVMNGRQVLDTLRSLDPKMPAVMISGIPGITELKDALKLPGVIFAQKPFKDVELLGAINKVAPLVIG